MSQNLGKQPATQARSKQCKKKKQQATLKKETPTPTEKKNS